MGMARSAIWETVLLQDRHVDLIDGHQLMTLDR